MDEFESNTYPRISNHTLAYFRFVDDIFMIWIGSKEGSFKLSLKKSTHIYIYIYI